ncbi:MAG: HEAT repeat domain-containing protein [Okeania sp. SIO3I5]|uniref:HEAT repeat domain-containing protein n=1 Tax=Okeania sp. SIO3I5 TaxID=2607805 RepID=UPI0013BAEA66|nr:HEAT repeat domain-containing protein [Okeania sp. SIO3I5]NEQ37591.1 HEAT repeat domain-containing protein [Okeania sp. SIO3I5]
MSTFCIGRTKEEKQFKEVLNTLISPDFDSYNSNHQRIFLFDGYGGIGKTTLLKKLQEITEEYQYAEQINSIFIDWEKQKNKDIRLRLGTENIQPITILDILFEKFSTDLEEYCFSKYKQKKELLQDTLKKIEEAEESSRELTQLNLDKDAWDIYHQPEEKLAPQLSNGINQLVEQEGKPLVIFFDTYEIIDSQKCDDAVRRVIKGTNDTIVWVIAGRFNLAKKTWRNEEVQLALLDKLKDSNPDIVKAAIESLAFYDREVEVEQLIKFLWPLENKHPDRYIREAAVRELGNLIDSDVSEKVLLQAVEPIVQTLRKDDISKVRNAAKKSLGQIYYALEEKVNLSFPPPEFTLAERTWRREDSKEDKLSKFYQEILPIEEELLSNKSQKEKVQLLTEFLGENNQDLDIRAAAARELGEIGSPTADSAIPKLINALDYSNKNSDRYLRQEAAEALSKLTPTIEIINALNTANRQDVISNVRNAAEAALKSIAAPNNSIGKQAQQYLDLMNPDKLQLQETSVENLIKKLEDEDSSVVAAVANVLGKIGDFSALESLLSKLEDIKYGDRVARQFVVTALGNLQSKLSKEGQNANLEIVIDTLINMWRNDAISSVRDAVEPAIQKIYETTRHPTAYKALKRYPDYKDQKVEDSYEKFFSDFPLN